MRVSPKYLTQLIVKIEETIWREFSSHQNAEFYIKRWHEEYPDLSYSENFHIFRYVDEDIHLSKTLREIEDDELLLKIAVDMGIEVPGLLYSIPEIKGILSSGYEAAATTFENALKNVSKDPAMSVGSANTALESIIKHICKDDSINSCNKKDTLYALTGHILKQFGHYPGKDMQSMNKEIRNIGSGLLTVAQNIEAMRSKYAISHGKAPDDYIIDDELYAKLVINAVTTVGLFMLNFYEKKYLPHQNQVDEDDIPF